MLRLQSDHQISKCFVAIVVAALSISLGGCRYLKNRLKLGSDVKVVGGDKDYEHNLGVIGILVKSAQGTTICTASVVRDDLIVTAAHCVVDKAATDVSPFFNLGLGDKDPFRSRNLNSSVFIPEPSYDPTDVASSYDSDIAFVVFPKGTFKDYPQLKFGEKAVALADTVTLVGYGHIAVRDKQSNPDLKRYLGTNQVHAIKADAGGTIWLDTNTVSPQTAGIGQGDSGGPLLNASGEIIGIAHANDFKLPEGAVKATNDQVTSQNPLISIYTNVSEPRVQEFIKRIMANNDPKPEVKPAAPAAVLVSKADALKCEGNQYCKDGWGWLIGGEADCSDKAPGWVQGRSGCSCSCD